MSLIRMNTAAARNVNFTLGIGGDGFEYVARDLYLAEVFERGLKFSESTSIKTDIKINAELLQKIEGWELIFSTFRQEGQSCSAFMRTDEDSILYLQVWGKAVYLSIAADNPTKIESTLAIVLKIFPGIQVVRSADSVPMAFWSLGPRGAVHRDKKIQPLLWTHIQKNYSDVTRNQIQSLRSVRPPLDGGRLVLWHGVPGTGKSSAIRNLVYEWLPWCDTSVVVDPENFFGSADYMLSVLLDTPSQNYEYVESDDEDEDEHTDHYVLKGKERWNLLIIEDADEFINSDAKSRTGQGLSRLLNLADGLIGQGMNFMLLITTNEKLKNIHSAVAREGRCFANTEFSAFNKTEAEAWLGEDFADEIKGDSTNTQYTLAQLFDKRRERQQIKTEVEEFVHGVYI